MALCVFCGQKIWKQRISTKKCCPLYGEHCLSRQEIHNWVQKFSEGRTSIQDEHRAGRPVEIATPETLQRVKDIIQAERRVTVDTSNRYWLFTWPGLQHDAWGTRLPLSVLPLGATPAYTTTQKPENGLVIAVSPALPGWRGRHAFSDRHCWWVLGAPLWAPDEACLHAMETYRVPSAQEV